MLASTWSGKLNSPPLDGWLESLTDDWYAAHKVFDAAVIAHDRAGEKDPEKKVEMERAEQRTDALYEQMVNAPAQGLRGIILPDHQLIQLTFQYVLFHSAGNNIDHRAFLIDEKRIRRTDHTVSAADAVVAVNDNGKG